MLAALFALLLSVALLPALPAQQAYAATNPYPTVQYLASNDPGSVPCTRYAWQQTYDRLGIALPAWGDGKTWLSYAQNAGIATGTAAKPNSIAVYDNGTHGHVEFVVSVGTNSMVVNSGGVYEGHYDANGNWVTEYNRPHNGTGIWDGLTRNYNTSGNNHCIGFIYPGVAANKAPVGKVDSISAGQGSISVSGWSYDPDTPSKNVEIRVYVDSTYAGSLTANTSRPDVDNAYHVGTNHGFSGTVNTTKSGSCKVEVFAINTSGSEPHGLLYTGTLTIQADNPPTGIVDTLRGETGRIAVSGWAYDQDTVSQTTEIRVYIDKAFAGRLYANTSRPDVDNAYHVGANHGFNGYIYTALTGSHTVEVFAINTSGKEPHKLLSSKTLTITADTTKPTVSNAEVIETTPSSYTIRFTASDNAAIAKIQVPSWNIANGSDDAVWYTVFEGIQGEGNTYTYTIPASAHGKGPYHTDIYVWDVAGNSTCYGSLPNVSTPCATHDFIDGMCAACGALKGDVNENSLLNIVDAQLAYDLVVGSHNFSETEVEHYQNIANVNGGELDASDAFAIQFAAMNGWVSE